MNDITKTPTPTLIAMHDEQTIFGDKDSGFANAIAAELDRRCEDLQIKDWECVTQITRHYSMFSERLDDANLERNRRLSEIRDLISWLLIREGK